MTPAPQRGTAINLFPLAGSQAGEVVHNHLQDFLL